MNIELKKLLLPCWYGAWIPPGINHEVWSNSSEVSVRTVFFENEKEKDHRFEQATVFPVSNLLKEMLSFTQKWHNIVDYDPEEFVFLLALKNILKNEITKSANLCLPSTANPKLSLLLDSLQKNLSEKWSLETVANQNSISPRTLTRIFSNNLGISFSAYCKTARAIKALELIENGADNVSEIAIEVGYDSISTFSNNFLEIWGNRPMFFINKRRRVTAAQL